MLLSTLTEPGLGVYVSTDSSWSKSLGGKDEKMGLGEVKKLMGRALMPLTGDTDLKGVLAGVELAVVAAVPSVSSFSFACSLFLTLFLCLVPNWGLKLPGLKVCFSSSSCSSGVSVVVASSSAASCSSSSSSSCLPEAPNSKLLLSCCCVVVTVVVVVVAVVVTSTVVVEVETASVDLPTNRLLDLNFVLPPVAEGEEEGEAEGASETVSAASSEDVSPASCVLEATLRLLLLDTLSLLLALDEVLRLALLEPKEAWETGTVSSTTLLISSSSVTRGTAAVGLTLLLEP